MCWCSYCENTDNDTVVEVVSISLSISVTDSTWLAALVITSKEKSEPAVVMLNTESESAIPPEDADEWVILSPDHEFNADPSVVVVISFVTSWTVVVVEFIEPWVN